MYSTVSNATRRTYPLCSSTGRSENAATNRISHAHHDTRRSRSLIVRSGPPPMIRRSAWRATHSSWPTAGPSCTPCGVVSVNASYLPDVRASEEPLWAEDHERDQDREDDQVGPLRRDVALRERLGEPEDQAAGHGARDRADAADHGRGEPLEADDEPDRDRRRDAQRLQHACGACERGPEDEREHDHAVDVDPHHRG